MSDKLTIKYVVDGSCSLGESFPGYTFNLDAETDGFSVDDWFQLFEKVLLASGFSEYVVMKGCMQLAFNSWRTTESMKKLYLEYIDELEQFAPPGKLPDEE
jgi:hypothetical protein